MYELSLSPYVLTSIQICPPNLMEPSSDVCPGQLVNTGTPHALIPALEVDLSSPLYLEFPLQHVSFKCTPEHGSDFKESDSSALATDANYEERSKEENLKLSPRSLCFLKDKTEAEYAMPWNVLQSEPRNQCKRSSESSILCPTCANQSNANKNGNRAKKSMYSRDRSADSIKEGRMDHPLVNDFIAKENESVRDNQARSPCPVKENILLPLHFEDVLKNPTIKIIDLGPTETVHYSTDTETVPTIKDRPGTKPIPSSSLDFVPFKAKESHTNPIIFHDKVYIMKLFLTKRFTPYVMTYTTKNVVLEKNCEMFKVLFDDTVSKPQRTKAVAHYKDLHIFSTERVHTSIKEKRKKQHDSLASKKRSLDTLYNLSQTFSILTQKIVGSFDKVASKEKSVKTGRFQRQFSKVKPPRTRKFTTLPMKYDLKPLKNILEIRKLNNISPLDDLLSWKVNGSRRIVYAAIFKNKNQVPRSQKFLTDY
ncbi:uncharacterized protein C1orf141 homolog isoform X2 [Arvicola amphibius]|uniref:uncharacterized protein C1orf141 homolog isoform X2 n=1 Tax=Arvicola amphibius TaxID=1047088 RepID=UPI0018E3D946|nr:uncharacterized protein C1orf141 homolog isoform X2 [Arvicola amphibius]